jgi:MFS family permease
VEHQSQFQALKQAVVLYLASVYFLIPMTVYGLVFFMPSQIAAVVHRKVGFEVGLISSILWIAALIATIVFPALSDRTGKRAQLDALLFIGAGLDLSGSVLAATPVLTILSLSIAAASFIAVQPIFWAMTSLRVPPAQASGAIVLINSLGAFGAFLAPNLRVAMDNLFQSSHAGIYGLAILASLGAFLLVRLRAPHLGAENLNAR